MPSHADLTSSYLAGVNTLTDSVRGMSREQLLARPVPGKWSTLEVVAHLADFEPIYLSRFKRVIALEKPLILSADDTLFAKHLAYHERDLADELRLIEAVRTCGAKLLQSIPEAAWQRQGVHTERGLISLEALVQSAVNHIHHHVKFIRDKRAALGL